ncbi:MAG: flagellar biosynthesis anti-sigma factor FlgM [Limnochordia bacterium]|jgi:negative regulator of flagellin synthesis FlgM
MMISDKQIQQVSRLYGRKMIANNINQMQPASKAADGVNLSKEAQELQAIWKKLQETPDVRMDRVKELRQAIQKGTYHVAGRDIAEKMLGRLAVDKALQD